MKRQLSASILAAILAVSVFSAIGMISLPMQRAAAQTVTVQTSADSHEGQFFGEGVLQVIITDPNKDDDNTQENISVNINAEPQEGGTDQSDNFFVPETSTGSNKFEFFLGHVNSTFAPAGAGLDADNSNGIDDYATVEAGLGGDDDAAPFITFGDGATELDTATELYDDVQFTITYEDEEVVVTYEESTGDLTLDRDTYGSTSLVHIFILDQDGNLDPTNPDEFTIPAANVTGPAAPLFTVSGGNFGEDLSFKETGDNTAKFEAIVELNGDIGDDNTFVPTNDGITLSLNEMANYENTAAAANNDTTTTSDESFSIDDKDGVIDDIGTTTFGTEIKATIRDNDQNVDSETRDTITDGLIVSTDSGDDIVTVDLRETGKNTGVFLPDSSNGEIKVTFVPDGGQIAGNDILELEHDDVTESITVAYQDPLNSDSDPEAFEQSVDLTLQTGQVSVPETVGVNDDFTVTLTDNDLNDNPRVKDVYSVTLDGTGPYPIKRGSTSLTAFATLDMQLEGVDTDFDTAITETLTETGIDTGIFEVTFDMGDILESLGATDINDGDTLEITYNDKFDDQTHEPKAEVSIGKANTDVDFSRTALPIPPADDTDFADVTGTATPQVQTTLTITDTDQNKNSNTEEGLDWCFDGDTGVGECNENDDVPTFTVQLKGSGIDEDIQSTDDFTGSVLEQIIPGLADLTLTETGKSTGVFEEDLQFEHSDLTRSEWQDLKLTITYIDTSDDDESAGITFRGNDGTVSSNLDATRAGDTLTVTVQDEDLNLDDTTAEEFPSSNNADGTFIVNVETEDDEIDASLPTHEQFRETGPDTGIFEASWTIGNDIRVTDVDGEDVTQATNILITYNDELDSTGGSGDELEVNVPVVSSTGAIQVSPDLVGPGTEVTVLITDLDLNKDSQSTETYTPDDPQSDNFFVNFRTDRNEVNEASPEIEETGANTGVFQFKIQLVTDETACEDDNLGDDSDFEATGGNDPSIGVCPGDLLSIKYEDQQDASGHDTTVSKVVEVKSYDPEFAADKDSYNVGDRVTVSISDPDANRDSDIADSLTDIRVYSDSDQVGQELSALETSKDSGVFKLSFLTTSGTTNGAISVKQGDDVTVQYTDDFPADFVDEENDKDFTFVVPIAGMVGTNATTPTAPSLKDVTGKTVDEVSAGQQVILSTTIVNNNEQNQPFAAIVEVRDSSGITVFLAWQTGSLNPSGQAEVGLSWTPDSPGNYTVRTFVISDIANPQILSSVKESQITVS